jgi:hypothetical protein
MVYPQDPHLLLRIVAVKVSRKAARIQPKRPSEGMARNFTRREIASEARIPANPIILKRRAALIPRLTKIE